MNGDEPGPPAPRANPLLIGHEAAERRLADAFAGGRLAHAWLIAGPRGIGKATLAYRFARFVLAGGGTGGGGLFAAGQVLGKLVINAPDMPPIEVPLVAANAVARLGPFGRAFTGLRHLIAGARS